MYICFEVCMVWGRSSETGKCENVCISINSEQLLLAAGNVHTINTYQVLHCITHNTGTTTNINTNSANTNN